MSGKNNFFNKLYIGSSIQGANDPAPPKVRY
jgi:hypothetical protein